MGTSVYKREDPVIHPYCSPNNGGTYPGLHLLAITSRGIWQTTSVARSLRTAQQAVAADRLRREYAWRVLLSIVLVIEASLARVGGG